MIIDTHSHLNFNAFKKDSDEVIKRSLADNIWLINVGTKYETSQKAVQIAKNYQKGVYSAIGLHPLYATAEFTKIKTDFQEGNFLVKEESFNKEKYKELAQSDRKKVVAIGEIGLDYYYKPKTTQKLTLFKEKQKQVLLQQLELAKELNLPLILHCRMAHQDLIEILKLKIKNLKLSGVVHCFTGNTEEMKQYIDLGFYIGFNGIIFKLNLDEVVKNCPLENMLVETDCPYLTPLPADGSSRFTGSSRVPNEALAKAELQGYIRNEPIFIKYTIQKIADLKAVSFQEVCDKTTENAKDLFKV